jgi:spermidine synthase
MSTQEKNAIAPQSLPRGSALLLLLSIFVVATCGLIYELLAGTLSTYLLGNSVTQFSLVIGFFLTAMGLGSFLSRYVTKNLIRTFLIVEIAVGIVGGCLTLVLFAAFALIDSYLPLLVCFSLVVGSLVGLEIPLIVRILRNQTTLRTALGNVLSLDYLGAFAASLAFPLLLVPNLGLVRTGFLFGLFNIAVAALGIYVFRHQLSRTWGLKVSVILSAVLLIAGLVTAGKATTLLEDMIYEDEIIFTKSTPYQRIVLTRWRGDLRLFIDGNIQFSTVDEFRYHEALVHPALSALSEPRSVLLLGAGDGMAAREVFKHPSVKTVHLVDLDPAITKLFSKHPTLRKLNKDALSDPRLKIFNEDALKFLEKSDNLYDAIIMDLPDPNNEGLGKLYSRSFYRLVTKNLSPRGVMVTQATSPFYSTAAFWCISNTIAASSTFRGGPGLKVLPYHASVPSFGEWGFVLAARNEIDPDRMKLTVKTRFLSPELLPTLFVFPKDIAERPTPVNRLDNQILVRLYEKGFRRYNK